MADFWSQFPTSGPKAPTFQPAPSLRGMLPSYSGGNPGGPINFNDPTPLANIDGPGQTTPYTTVGERNQYLYGPGSPLGGKTGITNTGPSSWTMYPTNNPSYFSGTIGGGRGTSTLGNFLNNPQAMQAVGGMARNIGGLFGNRPAQPQGGMMPMRGLFGSAMGSALGRGAQQAARVMMRAPDGTTQSVDPAHVDHYTGLGAQVINGSSYGGGGY